MPLVYLEVFFDKTRYASRYVRANCRLMRVVRVIFGVSMCLQVCCRQSLKDE